MPRIDGSVLLVGSVSTKDAEEAMRFCAAALGERLSLLSDGETGFRRIWINFLAYTTYRVNDALETVNQPEPVDPSKPDEWRKPGDDWIPKGYHDHWLFKGVPGKKIHFEKLGYAEHAIASYQIFKRLRDEGLTTAAQRFMVAMPMAESAVRPFVGMHSTAAADYEAMTAAYTEAMAREILTMLQHIPSYDLAIQWDVCMEVLALAGGDGPSTLFPWRLAATPMDRCLSAVSEFSSLVPDDVALGLHLCYGDLGHRHFIEPQDLSIVTRLANESTTAIARTLDFCHIPVPKDRADDAYFEPLRDWPSAAGKLYLGLVHHTDGVEGSAARLATAKRHIDGFGIATECGFGRRPQDTMPALMNIHRALADML